MPVPASIVSSVESAVLCLGGGASLRQRQRPVRPRQPCGMTTPYKSCAATAGRQRSHQVSNYAPRYDLSFRGP